MRYIVVEAEYCKGCGLCISACPQHVIVLSAALSSRGYHTAMLTDAESCTGCCFCAQVCPDVAIEVYLVQDEARHED